VLENKLGADVVVAVPNGFENKEEAVFVFV
jgi:hypothetical protein